MRLRKKYSKPTGSLSNWIFQEDIFDPEELLRLLKQTHQLPYDSSDDLDDVIDSRLNNLFEDVEGYIFFDGNEYNKLNFIRALFFYDDQIFKKSSIEINQLDNRLCLLLLFS